MSMPDKCDDAIAQLYEFLDGELDDVARARIEAHLRECSPCLEAFDFEADLRRIVSSRCRDRVPEELRERIRGLLQPSD